MKIVSQAPCRISLVGGGSDVDPFAHDYGGKVFNIAINLYTTSTLIPHKEKKIKLEALKEKRLLLDFKKKLNYGKDPKFDLVRAVINYFRKDLPSGFSLKVSTKAETLLGLGSSGSAAVSIISVFDNWLNKKMSPMEIAMLAFRMETEELGWPGGKQDQLAAAFGGMNLMTFGPKNGVGVIPLKLPTKTIRELQKRTFMVFVGGYRHSAKQQKSLIKSMSDKDKLQGLFALRDAVDSSIKALRDQNWSKLGEILDKGWEDKKKSNPLVTNEWIDKMYKIARESGAFGGKIAGSGGAGHMFFILPEKKKESAVKALVKAGAKLVDFDFDFKGVTTQVK